MLRLQNAKLRVNDFYQLYEFITAEEMTIKFLFRPSCDQIDQDRISTKIRFKKLTKLFQELINS